ncbi:hypothetical protein I302_101837 [Kwoniella bestiolae CBS 10118]|uniref:Uncharacterized protein n=1 Tax=Kwoniella bestiolae CBS 10118 TaxID=1296100 RepID=A0A1B9GDC7_9TREE|nr:hypothetical protein I302_00515 [Kwoniella bestiolae CBS 10118]OCF29024.1 hypothetical protein I302_00515 [Kwoniella bestiolae CBS 10118]
MQRHNRPPQITIDQRDAPRRPSLSSVEIPELITHRRSSIPSGTPSEYPSVFAQDWGSPQGDIQTSPTYPHKAREALQQTSTDYFDQDVGNAIPTGAVSSTGGSKDPSFRRRLSIRFGRWTRLGRRDKAPSSESASPGVELSTMPAHPSAPKGDHKGKGRLMVMDDGQVFRQLSKDDHDIKRFSYYSDTVSLLGSSPGSQPDTISALHQHPPDSVIINGGLYTYDPVARGYVPFGQVESRPGSPTSSSRPPSPEDWFDMRSRTPPLVRLPSQRSLNQGDETRFYGSNRAAESAKSLASVLAESQNTSPIEQSGGVGAGLRLDTSGFKHPSRPNSRHSSYRASAASFTSTIPSSPSSPTGSSPKSPFSPRRRDSTARLLSSIDTLPEGDESEEEQVQKRAREIHPSSDDGNLTDMSATNRSREPLTGLALKKEAWRRFWYGKVKFDFGSGRLPAGSPSPVISPITGRTLMPEEYGYERKYRQMPFVAAEKVARFTDEERERVVADVEFLNSQPSTSRIRMQTYDPLSFQRRVQEAEARVRQNTSTSAGLPDEDAITAVQDQGLTHTEPSDTARPTLPRSSSISRLSRRFSVISNGSGRLFG